MSVTAAQIENGVTDQEWKQLCDFRLYEPEVITREAALRVRRETVAPDGRLAIIAADHPGRGNTRILEDEFRMGDRPELISRVVAVLQGGLDGVMATPDLIEDLLALSALRRSAAGRGLLDGKVIVGCMQRGGLPGSAFEMDDRFTSITAAGLEQLGADGGKLMIRIDKQEVGSLRTLEAAGRACDEMLARGLVQFVEVLPVKRSESGSWETKSDPGVLIQEIGIGQAIGSSAHKRWLKVPFTPDFERVARSTTLPILILGGPPVGTAEVFLDQLRAAMEAGPNVCGAMVGRNVTYPGADSPAEVAAEIAEIVHRARR
jgi:DhnA family fructose-bisphosphate aldolase class Ia